VTCHPSSPKCREPLDFGSLFLGGKASLPFLMEKRERGSGGGQYKSYRLKEIKAYRIYFLIQ